MNYEVIREDESKLTRHRWRFWLNGTRVTLQWFARETRATTRHKYQWIAPDCYDRMDRRNGLLPVHMVPQPKDVRFEVLRQILASLQVVVTDGRGVEAPFAPDMEQVPMPPLRWESLPQARDGCFVDVDGLGRYLITRPRKGAREFRALLNGSPTAFRGTLDDVKKTIERFVAQRAMEKQ